MAGETEDLVPGAFPVSCFCGATPLLHTDEHLTLARAFGRMLGDAGMLCVNGGGGGLMTALAEGAAERGGKSYGVCLERFPPDHDAHTFVEHHPFLSPRQYALIRKGKAYVALPGGYGTISEVMDVISCKTLSEIPMDRLLVCVGAEDFASLKHTVYDVYRRGFSRHDPTTLVKFVATPEAAMELLIAARGAG